MHEVDIPKGAPRVKVVFPDDSKLRCIIDCLAEQVAKYGMQFEVMFALILPKFVKFEASFCVDAG